MLDGDCSNQNKMYFNSMYWLAVLHPGNLWNTISTLRLFKITIHGFIASAFQKTITIQELSSCWDGRPFGHNRHGPKSGGLLCPFPWGRELGPHLTQCRLGQALPPHEVASWSIQQFHHNRHGLKIGGAAVPLFWGGAVCPFNTVWVVGKMQNCGIWNADIHDRIIHQAKLRQTVHQC